MKCGAKFVGSWTGTTYICGLKGHHLYHKGYSLEGEDIEWTNSQDFCAAPFPGTNDICKRPPNHKGYCRVKVHNKVISFQIIRRF